MRFILPAQRVFVIGERWQILNSWITVLATARWLSSFSASGWNVLPMRQGAIRAAAAASSIPAGCSWLITLYGRTGCHAGEVFHVKYLLVQCIFIRSWISAGRSSPACLAQRHRPAMCSLSRIFNTLDTYRPAGILSVGTLWRFCSNRFRRY